MFPKSIRRKTLFPRSSQRSHHIQSPNLKTSVFFHSPFLSKNLSNNETSLKILNPCENNSKIGFPFKYLLRNTKSSELGLKKLKNKLPKNNIKNQIPNKKHYKFESSFNIENKRYQNFSLEEKESCKNFNFVSTPSEEIKNEIKSSISEIIKKELFVYHNLSPVNQSENVQKLEKRRSEKQCLSEFSKCVTPPPFSMISKLLKRKRLRKTLNNK